MGCRSSVVLVCCLIIGSAASHRWLAAADVASPLTPADAQKAFVLADSSLRIELAAAEPEVVDPVAIRFDEDGRMWVAEMRDYPLGNGGEGSRIRVLEDKDGDGRFESATTFADKLEFVTGLQPWKGGVFVTLSGAVVYMKDTDGDGRCDLEETWFEGFAEQNTQLRANHPRLALDNWIYVANGLRGGTVVSRKLKDLKPINISGMDFRFDPRTGKAEAVSGNGQFGLCFDDWGNRFVCSNRNPVRHVVIEDRYLKANPEVTVPAVMHDVAAWGEQSRIFPISRAWTTSNLHAGQFTAACGVYIYRGDLLPAEFKGNAFTCDPTGNLIHREIMQPAGPTFTSKAAYEGKEFLASPDEWFRPVNMELGPDGALYVVDMYRCVIEHPDFVPDELKRRPDQRLGDDRGRIWRIVPASLPLPLGEGRGEGLPSRRRPNLSKASNEDLIALLSHPNAWQRETAQRLLLERERQALAPRLRELAKDSPEPQARARALWLLAGIDSLEKDLLLSALLDSQALLKRQAVLIAEQKMDDEAIAAAVRSRRNDADAAVRFQARLSGGSAAFLRRAVADADDPWLRASLRMGLKPLSVWGALYPWLAKLNGDDALSPGQLLLIEELGELGGANTRIDRRNTLTLAKDLLLTCPQPSAGLAALAGALRGRNKQGGMIAEFTLQDWQAIAERLVVLTKDDKLRPSAIQVLGYVPDSVGYLTPFVARGQDQGLRVAAIAALARQPGALPWQPLVDGFASDTPPVRRAILDALLSRPERVALLLDAIEAGKIKASELESPQVKRLVEHRDAAIKERAAKLLASAVPADRAQALADYQPVLKMAGDAKRGQAIFEKNCSACHRIAGIGVNVAPDISDSRTKKLDQLLGDILQPNRAIDNNYLGYTVRLTDGTIATGILTTETATSITLKQQGGKEAVIARSEIDELRSSGQSLMPEGLERTIPHQDMADLLSFIKNWRYLDGRTPLLPARD
ncbi:MAG TPA: PVC-type heme-binding CxxCH protein [Pirellulaceae bacterium]|nr:PVC-type heme-binding CxxCH protein [Pirellulaceae bacterium]